MSNITQVYVEEYLRGLLPQESPSFSRLRQEAEAQNLPIISPEVGQFLRTLIVAHQVTSILEIGTAIGYSACVMADAMGEAGRLVTVDRDEGLLAQARENIPAMGFDGQIEIVQGDAQVVLEELTGEFELIFLDGGKGHYPHLLEDCLRLLAPGGLLVADNVLYKGMVASRELLVRREITIVKRMQKYLAAVTTDERVTTTVLPLGDGVALSVKR